MPEPSSSSHDQSLLVAINRAAAFGVAARWVLHELRSPAQCLTLAALHPPADGAIARISVREPIAFLTDLQRASRAEQAEGPGVLSGPTRREGY